MNIDKSYRPLIGITCSSIDRPDWHENDNEKLSLTADLLLRHYSSAIAKAGGLPLIISPVKEPMLDTSAFENNEDDDDFNFPITACGPQPLHINAKAYLKRLDALVLSGGGDIGPLYTQSPSPLLRNLDRTRDNWETALLGVALDLKKPVLGICRGMQIINFALGGTLYNDLASEKPSEIKHQQKTARHNSSHNINLIEKTLLANILDGQANIMVNSSHHQGINQLAPSLKAVALADDGLIEAIEDKQGSFLLGVQWHPEALNDQASKAIFTNFIKAAQQSENK